MKSRFGLEGNCVSGETAASKVDFVLRNTMVACLILVFLPITGSTCERTSLVARASAHLETFCPQEGRHPFLRALVLHSRPPYGSASLEERGVACEQRSPSTHLIPTGRDRSRTPTVVSGRFVMRRSGRMPTLLNLGVPNAL